MSNNKEVLRSISPSDLAKGIQELDLTCDNLPVERTLGVQWCVDSDTFQFRIVVSERPMTRRGILSTISSVYDPLGLLAPFVLIGKQILQELCKDKAEWDEMLPERMRPRWMRWLSDLQILPRHWVPRSYKPENFGEIASAQLHNFSDASQNGYGQCSYLRIVNKQNEIHCVLVMAKSRVSPIKSVTIPRLELTAALISARVNALLRNELEYINLSQVFWTDSKVVLGYVNNQSRRFHVFVANRIQQIHDLSSPTEWKYVETQSNPADLASRGAHAEELINSSKWWKGPEFLWLPIEEDRGVIEDVSELSIDDPEVKRVSSFASQTEKYDDLEERLCYFSNLSRAKSAVALCLRYMDILKAKRLQSDSVEVKEKRTTANTEIFVPTVADLKETEKVMIRSAQRKAFAEEISVLQRLSDNQSNKGNTSRNSTIKKGSRLYKLDPYLDDEGLLRVGGRIRNAALPIDLRHPILLPKECHLTQLIVGHYHEQCQHQGRGITLSTIRSSGYWIVGGASAVNHHIHHCVKCRKWRGSPQQQKMADLPVDRLDSVAPFTYSAVDYFGPWLIKEGRRELKRYGVLFTCMASRSIHLEIAHSLDTSSFLNAYRRFVGRRGPVRQLRSDRGTNFIGGENELKNALEEMNKDKVKQELLKENCDFLEFKMNVPHASHMGGVWERQIRSVRSVLRVLLDGHGKQLDDESLHTFFVETESIVNSRPLTSENTVDLTPLSPNNLLTMKSSVVLPPPGNFDKPDLYSRKRWRRVQYLANQFWSQWRKRFLLSLQQRQKWSRPKKNLMVGDVVLLVEENIPRNKWQLARVVETYPESDRLARKVKVLVATQSLDKNGKRCEEMSCLERPIHKLVLLLSNEENRGFPTEESWQY